MEQHRMSELPARSDRLLAVLCQTSVVWCFALFPLVFWLYVRHRSGYLRDQAASALNFQVAGYLVGVVVTLAAVIATQQGASTIGTLLLLAFTGGLFWFGCRAAWRAWQGKPWGYPIQVPILAVGGARRWILSE